MSSIENFREKADSGLFLIKNINLKPKDQLRDLPKFGKFA